MKKTLLKNLVSMAVMALIVVPAFALALPALATAPAPATATLDPWGGGAVGTDPTAESLRAQTGLGDTDPREVAAGVINAILGFLGIIAVVIILLGGFKWMTAGGNEDKVAEARKLIVAGVIGLIIILAAFAIARFVITNLMTATGAVTGV